MTNTNKIEKTMITETQNTTIEDSASWILRVIDTQKRFMQFADLWIAYPYKINGLTKDGLKALYEETIKAFVQVHK